MNLVKNHRTGTEPGKSSKTDGSPGFDDLLCSFGDSDKPRAPFNLRQYNILLRHLCAEMGAKEDKLQIWKWRRMSDKYGDGGR